MDIEVTQTLEVTEVKGVDGLLSIRSAWEDLYYNCPNRSFYNHWAWHESLAKNLLDGDLHYFLLTQRGLCLAIFPLHLVEEKNLGFRWRVFTFPRHKHVEMMDALIRQGVNANLALNALIEHLINQRKADWDQLLFPKVRERASIFAALKQTRIHLQSMGRSFYLKLDSTNPPEQQLSHKHLKNIDRLTRKVESEHGALSFVHCSDTANLDEAFAVFLQLESSGWKGKQGKETCIQSNPRHLAHYRHLLRSFAPTGDIAVNLLKLGDKAIAGQLCIRAAKAWHLMKIAYDESYRAYAPGNILVRRFLAHLLESPGQWELNLVTGPPWAERWHFSEEAVYCAEFYNTTVHAGFIVTLRKARKVLASLLKKTKLKNPKPGK